MNAKESHFRSFQGKAISSGSDVQVLVVKFTKETSGLPSYAVVKQYRSKTISFDREVAILQELSGLHPNIVTYYYHILTAQKCFLFLEYCRLGSLADEIQRRQAAIQPWTDLELTHHFQSLISAMRLIHERRIVHRDIKPENIFLTEKGEMKIGDFGEAKQVRNGMTDEQATLRGTWEYMSPQGVSACRKIRSLSNGECANNDVWMMGRTFYEMAVCTRRPDLNPMTPFNASVFYTEIESTLHSADCSAPLISLILSMLVLDSRDRPTFQSLLQAFNPASSSLCNVCGSPTRHREPFQCSHLLCAGCYLQLLAYIRDRVTALAQVVCPVCQARISPLYFARHDYDPGATTKISTLHLLSKTLCCPFCFDLHPKYQRSGDHARPYLLQCKGKKACSHCLRTQGHEAGGEGWCPEFTLV